MDFLSGLAGKKSDDLVQEGIAGMIGKKAGDVVEDMVEKVLNKDGNKGTEEEKGGVLDIGNILTAGGGKKDDSEDDKGVAGAMMGAVKGLF